MCSVLMFGPVRGIAEGFGATRELTSVWFFSSVSPTMLCKMVWLHKGPWTQVAHERLLPSVKAHVIHQATSEMK